MNIPLKIFGIPNGIISAQTDPVGNGSVLLHLLAESALNLKRLERRLHKIVRSTFICPKRWMEGSRKEVKLKLYHFKASGVNLPPWSIPF